MGRRGQNVAIEWIYKQEKKVAYITPNTAFDRMDQPRASSSPEEGFSDRRNGNRDIL